MMEAAVERTFNAAALDSLADALEQLDMISRDVIILHYYADRSFNEIAEAMGMSYSDIELLNRDALEQLQRLIKL